MVLPIPLDVKPMLAKLSRTIPDRDDLLFEPKWDGFRCLVFRDGDELTLMSRNQKPFNRYFPELIDPLLAAMPPRSVIDGEIVLPDEHGQGLNFDALQQRIHPAQSRVTMLARATPTNFVAFDLLALDDTSHFETPLRQRRELLERHLIENRSVHLTPASTSRAVGERWFTQFEGAGLDGVLAKPLDGIYEPNKRALLKIKHQRTTECAVAGFRVHKDGVGVGSLLLGLYDDDGDLRSVGVCAGFSQKFRSELITELQPLVIDPARDQTRDQIEEHPWRSWIEAQIEAGADGKPIGGGSRWNANKDLSFVPVRVERVVEVTFGQLEAGRFRHGVKFIRWRPDRDPESCRYEQLDVATPVRFEDLLAEIQP